MAQLMMVRGDLENLEEIKLPAGCSIHTLDENGGKEMWGWICSAAFGSRFDFDEIMTPDACCSPERVFFVKQYAQDVSTASAWHFPEYGAHTGYLHWVATHPTAVGFGTGRQAILAALHEMRNLGYTRAILLTDDFRLPAIKTYKALGFHPVIDKADLYEADVRPESDPADVQAERRALWEAVDAKLAAPAPENAKVIPLWENGAPLFDASYNQPQPSIKCFPIEGSRGAVVVCPGGAYVMKATHEGDPIARMLNAAGISAFVLDYRVAPYVMPAPILDAQRAIRLVRSLGYEKVGILGFSAGGHLTAMAGTMYDCGNSDASDPIDRLSCRPDAFIPCYAVISFSAFTHCGSRLNIMGKDADNWPELRRMSAELRVTSDTPPCFMWHTASDGSVPVENSLRMAEACVRCGVPVELHVFPEGNHGLGLAGGTHVGQWGGLCQNWLLRLGFGK